jgi:hypothetical protein
MMQTGNNLYALEQASFYGRMEELKQLIEDEALVNDGGAILQNETSLYQLYYSWQLKRIEPEDMVQTLQYMSSDLVDHFFGIRLLHAYGCYALGQHDVLKGILNTLQERLQELEKYEVYSLYRFRLNDLCAKLYLRQNELLLVQQETGNILKFCPKSPIKASAYHTRGLSYLYDNFNSGQECLQYALLLYQQFQHEDEIKRVMRTIHFFHNYWGKYTPSNPYPLTEPSNDRERCELAHYEYRNRNVSRAADILDGIPYARLSRSVKGYYHFYRGLIYQSVDELYKSIRCFKEEGNKFAANMSRLELYRLNERPSAIEAAYQS